MWRIQAWADTAFLRATQVRESYRLDGSVGHFKRRDLRKGGWGGGTGADVAAGGRGCRFWPRGGKASRQHGHGLAFRAGTQGPRQRFSAVMMTACVLVTRQGVFAITVDAGRTAGQPPHAAVPHHSPNPYRVLQRHAR